MKWEHRIGEQFKYNILARLGGLFWEFNIVINNVKYNIRYLQLRSQKQELTFYQEKFIWYKMRVELLSGMNLLFFPQINAWAKDSRIYYWSCFIIDYLNYNSDIVTLGHRDSYGALSR